MEGGIGLRPGERVVILGIGNELRRDDGLGVVLARRLKDELPFPVLEGGNAPENLLGEILDLGPNVVVIVDAVDFGGRPGEIRKIEREEVEGLGFSTHGPSVLPLVDFLEREGIRTIILGVQPEDIRFGTGLSPKVQEAISDLEEMLRSSKFLDMRKGNCYLPDLKVRSSRTEKQQKGRRDGGG